MRGPQRGGSWEWLAWGLYAAHSLFLLLTLTHYGVTWDEPPWFRFGDFQWELLAGGPRELPPVGDASWYARDLNFVRYGSVSSLVAAASRRLFHDGLGWIEADPARHLGNLLFALGLGLGVLLWARQVLGSRGAALAIGFWALLPRLWPDAHNNLLDVPGAAGALAAAWAAWRITREPRARPGSYALFGALLGLCFCLRAPNAYFLGLAIALWAGFSIAVLRARWPAFAWWGVALAAGVFLVSVKTLTPLLWDDSVVLHVLRDNPRAYLEGNVGQAPILFRGRFYDRSEAPLLYAPWTWLVSTPLLVVVAQLSGLVRLLRAGRGADPTPWLWLVLFAVGVGKHLLGGGNYDGVRHFMEALAPMVLLAAWGAEAVLDRAAGWRRPARAGLAGLAAVGVAVPLAEGARIHPYQTAYFNALAGGASRAWERYDVDYWGQGFLPASHWIRRQLAPGTLIVAPVAPVLLRYQLGDGYRVVTRRPMSRSAAPDGAALVLLNRAGMLRQRRPGADPLDCPADWPEAFRAGPEGLPPSVVICVRSEEGPA